MNKIITIWNTLMAAVAMLAVSLTAGKPYFFNVSETRRNCFFITLIVIGAIIATRISAISNDYRRCCAFIYLHLLVVAAIFAMLFVGGFK